MNSYEHRCEICYERIPYNYTYAMIDVEYGHYHVYCLERWLEKNKKSILTKNIIQSYTIYQNHKSVKQNIVSLTSPLYHNMTIKESDDCCVLF